MSDEPNELTERAEAVNERAQALAERAEAEPDFTRGEKIFFGGVLAAFVALMGSIVYAGVKEEQREQEEAILRNEKRRQDKEAVERWLNNQENDGNKVYKLQDGRYLSVDSQANQTTHLVTQIQEDFRNTGVV